MSVFGVSKFSQFVVGFASFLSLAGAVTANPVHAAMLDFRDWKPIGDTNARMGGLSMSTNSLRSDDDFKNDGVKSPDTDFNYSGNPAIEISQLEANLELPPLSLNLEPSKAAYEGSGIINTQLTLTKPTTLSFDWTFLTNETFATNDRGDIDPFPDYAFISINGVINSLANALNSLTLSNSTYHSQISGRFSRLLTTGVYSIAFGVLDVSDLVVSSALVVNNAELIAQISPDPNPNPDPDPDPVAIPEPSSALALLLGGGLGVGSRMWKSRSA